MSEWIPTHGKRATYLAGCRCEACKAVQKAYRQRPEVTAAQKAYQKAYRKRLVAWAKLAQAHGLKLPEES